MIDRPSVPDVLPLLREYYAMPGNSVGGAVHIVIEDANVEDSSVAYCIIFARERGDVPGERLAETLSRMTRTQRLRLRAKL